VLYQIGPLQRRMILNCPPGARDYACRYGQGWNTALKGLVRRQLVKKHQGNKYALTRRGMMLRRALKEGEHS